MKNGEEKEAECLDDDFPHNMQECVSDINDDKNGGGNKQNETECIDNTYPDEMGEGVNDRCCY